jgi:hypothetical protein
MIGMIRIFILVAAVSLIVASLIHLEVLMEGYRHQEAGIAEAVIAAGMLIGLAFTWLSGRRGLWAGMISVAFGLLGTLVGLFTIAIGVGPQTTSDLIYHITLTAVLVTGLVLAWQALSKHRGRTS